MRARARARPPCLAAVSLSSSFPPAPFHRTAPNLAPRLASPTTRCRGDHVAADLPTFFFLIIVAAFRIEAVGEENARRKERKDLFIRTSRSTRSRFIRLGCFPHVEIHCLTFSQIHDTGLVARPKFIFAASHTSKKGQRCNMARKGLFVVGIGKTEGSGREVE